MLLGITAGDAWAEVEKEPGNFIVIAHSNVGALAFKVELAFKDRCLAALFVGSSPVDTQV